MGISKHQSIDSVADGLRRPGKPVHPQAAMLCGPLVTDSDQDKDGGKLLGVVQLLERRPKAASSTSPVSKGVEAPEDFSTEELALFPLMLRICTQGLLRALSVKPDA